MASNAAQRSWSFIALGAQRRNSPRATTTARPPTSTRSIPTSLPWARAYRVEGRLISSPWEISISVPQATSPCRQTWHASGPAAAPVAGPQVRPAQVRTSVSSRRFSDPAMQLVHLERSQSAVVGLEPGNGIARPECDEREERSVVVALDRQLRPGDAECGEQRVRLGIRLHARNGLDHAPKAERAGLVPLELDGNDAHARLELDDVALQRRPEHPGRAERRMPGKGARRPGEDPHASRPPVLGGKNERRLGEADLAGERLHRPGIQLARIREDGELVPGERTVGEDVDDDEAEGRHVATLSGLRRGISFRRGRRNRRA